MSTPCQLIIEPMPLDGETNMARDAELLAAAVENGECFLRLYMWSEPTLSLGYFQKPDAVPDRFDALPCVRRLSGGGAILHHNEVTYSCAVPKGHPLAARPTSLYGLVHDRIIATIEQSGVPIRLRGKAAVTAVEGVPDEPFLCFLRRDPHDLVVGEHKVLGSAQRRRKGAVLQHGSLLLERSEYAPQILGLNDLGGQFEASSVLSSICSAVHPLFD